MRTSFLPSCAALSLLASSAHAQPADSPPPPTAPLAAAAQPVRHPLVEDPGEALVEPALRGRERQDHDGLAGRGRDGEDGPGPGPGRGRHRRERGGQRQAERRGPRDASTSHRAHLQVPMLHMCPLLHLISHLPQFFGSFWRSTQVSPHSVLPGLHSHAPALQT